MIAAFRTPPGWATIRLRFNIIPDEAIFNAWLRVAGDIQLKNSAFVAILCNDFLHKEFW